MDVNDLKRIGIGGLSDKHDHFAFSSIKFQEMNLKVIDAGTVLDAAVRGAVDVMVVDCYTDRGLVATSFGRFISRDIPSIAAEYEKVIAHSKGIAQSLKRSQRSILGGYSFLGNVEFESDACTVPTLFSFSFVSSGEEGIPLSSAGMLRNAIDNLCTQLRSRCGSRRLRIGIPRIYDGVGGSYIIDVISLLLPIVEKYPDYEFIILTDGEPDSHVKPIRSSKTKFARPKPKWNSRKLRQAALA